MRAAASFHVGLLNLGVKVFGVYQPASIIVAGA
jgi:hypothetical protein